MWSTWCGPSLALLLILNGALIGSSSSSSSSSSFSDSKSCQCGVFLLGAPPLQFSEDAKPVLAGDPVSTNCTSPKDRTDCSTICRRLIQSMDNPKSPLFQAVVLTASRTLACQRFNSSVNTKVPLPRIHINSPWTRNIAGSSNNNKRETDAGTGLSEGEPKWLGGFYRWCDVHWIYAGASVHEPLCCSNGLPTKCPESVTANRASSVPRVRSAAGNSGTKPFLFSTNRNPRLIIKKRPEDDISEEDIDDDEDVGGGEQENDLTETSSPSSTATTNTADDDEANAAENDNAQSFEKIDPLKVIEAATIENQSSKLNSTILVEAFSWVGAIMRTLGLGDVTDGIKTVLPTSTATELLKKVDVGGWVGKYQDQYVKFGREYNLGYCYLEYGLYNVASEGVGNMLSRVFSTNSGGSSNINSISASNNMLNDLTSNGNGFGFGMNTNYIKTYHRRGRRDTSTADNAALFHDAVGHGHFETVSNASISKPTKMHINTTPHRPQSDPGQKTKSARRQQPSNGPNLMNMANMLLQMAAGAGDNGGGGGGGGGGGDNNMNSILQNALPLVSQFATSPMIQGAVSNLVTSFLTPPEPSNNNNFMKRPLPPAKTGLDDNEIEERPPPPPKRPSQQQNQPPPGQQDSGLTGMLGQIVQTYLKHYFSGGNTNTKTPPPTSRPSVSKPPKNSATTTTTASTPVAEERTDIVETISEVAKPFFLSYFGVVPGSPGYGQLSVADRTGRDTLSYDPDPGTSLTDLMFGSVNIPTTGNSLFDFGNRISFAFGRANDPTQGLFCFKQYSVNKLWDGFRFVVKTLFK